ncbi:MAG TPA: GNAT family protein [Niabella sp.]|nr:GNAT family protein [Niabella sp.]HQW14951.1 GNAT family protein [Niabella sp.]HQX20157.1 GNAT family protein [Niabella sp.]HQX41913.1 GNAT family protein [Niabella sp.]HRB06762.1 GNAT family protein [Niabella sp.]
MIFDFEEELVLENDRVLLRPVVMEDVSHLQSIALQEKELLQYSPNAIHTLELLKAYIKNAISLRENKTRYSFIIFDKWKNAYAGSTSFLNISQDDDRLEIGATFLGKSFQRTGLNRNCKYLLLEYAFDHLKAERVELRTDERNISSRNAIEKLGARLEGVLRKHMVMFDGYRRNTVCYSILKEEWALLKTDFL